MIATHCLQITLFYYQAVSLLLGTFTIFFFLCNTCYIKGNANNLLLFVVVFCHQGQNERNSVYSEQEELCSFGKVFRLMQNRWNFFLWKTDTRS